MLRRSSRNKPRDLKLLAASTVDEATAEEAQAAAIKAGGKNPHAVALGRLGGSKGGTARARKLTAEQRREIAARAAAARWHKSE
jgi:hypothetical protein